MKKQEYKNEYGLTYKQWLRHIETQLKRDKQKLEKLENKKWK